MLPTQKDETPTLLRNPTKQDFKHQMANDENIPKEYVLPSRKIVSFPKYIADHLAKHLAQKMALEEQTVLTAEGSVKIHYEDRFKRALENIYVVL